MKILWNNFTFSGLPSVTNMFMMLCLRLSIIRFFFFLFCVYLIATNTYIVSLLGYPSPPLSHIHRQNLKHEEEFNEHCRLNNYAKINMGILASYYFQSIFLVFSILSILITAWLQFTKQINFVAFSTNLNLFKKGNYIYESNLCLCLLSINIMMVLLSDFEICHFIYFIIYMKPNFFSLHKITLRFRRIMPFLLFYADLLTILSCATTPASHFLCICLLQIMCYHFVKYQPPWISFLLIIMANDIGLNPGPEIRKKFLHFMNWNLNSLSKNKFERVHFLEAHNAIFNYDIVSICESSLTDALTSQVPKINGYEFVSTNHPADFAHGGVAVYYKDNLPVTVRRDVSFDESIVLELNFGRKKIFFTVLYRSPSIKHSSPEFEEFIQKFKNLHSRIKLENPYTMFFTGDFNAHSQFWWPGGDTNIEGREIEELFFSLNLTQVISEPTNFEPDKLPSCIDLIVTDQPNLILDSGTRASLDCYCHHQIIFGKINFKIPSPPPSERLIWHYDRANVIAI